MISENEEANKPHADAPLAESCIPSRGLGVIQEHPRYWPALLSLSYSVATRALFEPLLPHAKAEDENDRLAYNRDAEDKSGQA